MSSVNYGTKAKYNAIATKDNDALYFCTDTLELYKGSVAYSKAVKFVSTLPTGDAISPNVVYALADGTIKSWDPAAASGAGAWVTIGVPKTTTVAAAATASDDLIPTEKAVRTALDTDITNLHIENYAPLASPALTGTPTAPTAAQGTDTTQIATTAFVKAACDQVKVDLGAAFEFKGVVANVAALEAIVDPNPGDVYQVTTGESGETNVEYVYVSDTGSGQPGWIKLGAVLDLSGYAPLASPALTGTPTAPTATTGDSSTQIATTAFVSGAITDLNISQYAPLASPSFTGTPTAPTAAESTNNTQIATTSFVHTVANSAEAAAKAASDPAGSASAAESAAKTYTDNKLAWVSFN